MEEFPADENAKVRASFCSGSGKFCSDFATFTRVKFSEPRKTTANIAFAAAGIAVAKERAVVNVVPVATQNERHAKPKNQN
ncbi:MAG: hypothetical protein RLZZ350_210 [Verrucomicrobiota bacterium]|jgi:hypothetical protein